MDKARDIFQEAIDVAKKEKLQDFEVYMNHARASKELGDTKTSQSSAKMCVSLARSAGNQRAASHCKSMA